jgi:hypothetical protein
VKGLDEVLTEEIVIEVQGKIFHLIWSDESSRQSEFLEIAFADKVRDLTTNAINRYKESVKGERDQLDVWAGVDSGKGAFEVVELRADLPDPRPNPEELLILREDEAPREKLLRVIRGAVKNPRHYEVLYRFHAEGESLSKIAARFDARISQIRNWKTTAMHQIRFALGIETEEKREALRKRRAPAGRNAARNPEGFVAAPSHRLYRFRFPHREAR